MRCRPGKCHWMSVRTRDRDRVVLKLDASGTDRPGRRAPLSYGSGGGEGQAARCATGPSAVRAEEIDVGRRQNDRLGRGRAPSSFELRRASGARQEQVGRWAGGAAHARTRRARLAKRAAWSGSSAAVRRSTTGKAKAHGRAARYPGQAQRECARLSLDKSRRAGCTGARERGLFGGSLSRVPVLRVPEARPSESQASISARRPRRTRLKRARGRGDEERSMTIGCRRDRRGGAAVRSAQARRSARAGPTNRDKTPWEA